jgi:hypothetical protein
MWGRARAARRRAAVVASRRGVAASGDIGGWRAAGLGDAAALEALNAKDVSILLKRRVNLQIC